MDIFHDTITGYYSEMKSQMVKFLKRLENYTGVEFTTEIRYINGEYQSFRSNVDFFETTHSTLTKKALERWISILIEDGQRILDITESLVDEIYPNNPSGMMMFDNLRDEYYYMKIEFNNLAEKVNYIMNLKFNEGFRENTEMYTRQHNEYKTTHTDYAQICIDMTNETKDKWYTKLIKLGNETIETGKILIEDMTKW